MSALNPLPLLQLMRPHQWLKNGFVLVGLLFGHAWQQPAQVQRVLWAFVAFCLLSSAVYVFNDLIDREQDRQHPQKRQRPLASGRISVWAAMVLMSMCLIGGMLIAVLRAGNAPWIFAAYVALNFAYTLQLKHIVILDVFLIATGFMLRILAGTLGVGIVPSQWLLLCGLMLTLFLGFAKRRAELSALGDYHSDHRRVLKHYSLPLLDQMITVSATGTVVSYSLYTLSAETVALHGTTQLITTVPLVLYGMFRYLFLLHQRGGGGDAAKALLTDPHLICACLGWLALVLWLLL